MIGGLSENGSLDISGKDRTLEQQAVSGAKWLGSLKLASQVVSWAMTIIIARILFPEDYALSALATMIAGYAEIISELGLGASIVQRSSYRKNELSSVFWFALIVSVIFSLSCIPISYFTAAYFNELRVIPLTQAVGVLFILTGLQIVPISLLKRSMKFREIGIIELIATVISSIAMIVIALKGGGAWALIGGRIIRGAVKLCLAYVYSSWTPTMHFKMSEVKHYVTFGLTVVLSSTLFYAFEMSDRFFAGRAWSLEMLGYYLFALQLAHIPTDKIVALVNQISFPTFSRMRADSKKFVRFYLNVLRVNATMVLPIFIGGFIVGDELVIVVLGEKWQPMTYLFQVLCLVQIVTALNSVNNIVHLARGNVKQVVLFNLVAVLTMSASFYVAVQYRMNAILIPWLTTYVLLCGWWIVRTISAIGVSIPSYFSKIRVPAIAAFVMAMALIGVEAAGEAMMLDVRYLLFIEILVGAMTYVSLIWLLDRKLVHSLIARQVPR